MNNFGKFTYMDFKKIDKKKLSKDTESIEDFINRGGNINRIDNRIEMPKRIQQDRYCGSNVGTSKLTEEQILEIRRSELPAKELSKIYNVHVSTISKVKTRSAWGHIRG